MKKLLLCMIVLLVSSYGFSQTTRFWKGYGGSDDISDGSNWFNGNPSSGDNLSFNNTGGDCGNTGRRNAFSNYGAGSFFGELIVFNCAKNIKFYGNNSYFLKIENNNSPDLLEVANGIIGSRTGNNIEINPVGSGGLLISSATVTIDNTTSSKSILIYGTQGLTINSAITDVNGTGGQVQLMNSSTVTLGGTANNTYSGNTTTFSGGGLLILNKSAGIKAVGNNLIINSGSSVRTNANNQLGTGTPALVTINGNGIFNGNGTSQKIALASASSTASVTMGAGALNIDNTGTDSYAGVISGATATLTKSNSGSQALTGANTYTGLTTVSGGTLQLNRSGGTTIPSTNSVAISGTGILRISSNQTVANFTMTAGTITVDAGVTLTITGTYSASGGTINNLGTIKYSGGSVTFPGTGVSINNGTANTMTNFEIASGGTVTLGSDLIVSGTLTLTSGALAIGANTLTLNGMVTGSGTLTGNASGGSSTSNIVIGGTAGTLNFTQTDATTRSLNNLTLSSSSASATLGTALDVYGNIKLNDGTLALGGQHLTLKSNTGSTATIDVLKTDGSNLTGATSVTVERWIPLRSGNASNGGRAYRLLTPTVTTTSTIRANWMEGGQVATVGATSNPVPNYGTHISGAGGNTNGFDVTASNQSSLYTYVNGSNINNSSSYTPIGSVTTGSTLNALTGYFLYVRGDRAQNITLSYLPGGGMPTSSTTLRATGTVQTGPVNFVSLAPLSTNMSMVTNPYPAPLDWQKVFDANNILDANIASSYTVWDPNVGIEGGFVTVAYDGSNNTAGSTAGRYIQPGEAFMVQSTGGVTFVNFAESMKAAGNNSNGVFFAPPPPTESFRTTLYYTDGGGYRRAADGILVNYNSNYNAGVDNDDASEVNNWNENIAISREAKHLGIEYRPGILSKDTIPLFMNKMRQMNYEFEFTPSAFSNTALKAELLDNYLGTRTLLSVTATTIVPFTVTSDAASWAPDRFTVVFGAFGGPLAVDLMTVNAYKKNGGVEVDWTAKTEADMDHYEVERSGNGSSFEKLGTTAAMGNSNTAVNYSWLDASPKTGNNFYRIRGMDRGGNMRYSPIVKVLFGKDQAGIVVNPNPVSGNSFSLDMNNLDKGTYQLNLINDLGQNVFSTQVIHQGGSATKAIVLNKELVKGVYQLVLTNSSDVRLTQRVIKN